MRRLVLTAALLLALDLPTSAFDLTTLNERATGVVRVEAVIGDQKGQCSGALLTPAGLVITAAHCIEGAKSVTVNGRPAGVVRIGSSSRVDDLALLRVVSVQGEQPIPVATVMPKQLDQVIVLGFPGGSIELIPRVGVVSVLRSRDTLGYMVMNLAVIPGDSGGPVLNASGELVGISVELYHPVLGGAVPLDVVRAFIAPFLT